jgi:RHH-type transcriptional regulator, rel operon repressor / antitoxin RelB
LCCSIRSPDAPFLLLTHKVARAFRCAGDTRPALLGPPARRQNGWRLDSFDQVDERGIDASVCIVYSVIQINTEGAPMSTAVSIRLPDALARELDHIAGETERPRSFHIQKALESYIEDFADVQIALDRLRDQKDPVISSYELRKSLGL